MAQVLCAFDDEYYPRTDMYVLAIVGSPRKRGNTDVLVDYVIDGVREAREDARVEKLYVNDLDLKPCLGTLTCRKAGKCMIDDDMGAVLEKLKMADGLILASPVYRRYLPGQMKIFMDRVTPLEKELDMDGGGGMDMKCVKAAFRLMPGFVQKMTMRTMIKQLCSTFRIQKKVNSVVIVVGGHPGELAMMQEDMRRIEDELGFFSMMTNGRVVEALKAPGIMEKGEVQKHGELLMRAKVAGKKLAASLAA